jgi:hypothetical protein
MLGGPRSNVTVSVECVACCWAVRSCAFGVSVPVPVSRGGSQCEAGGRVRREAQGTRRQRGLEESGTWAARPKEQRSSDDPNGNDRQTNRQTDRQTAQRPRRDFMQACLLLGACLCMDRASNGSKGKATTSAHTHTHTQAHAHEPALCPNLPKVLPDGGLYKTKALPKLAGLDMTKAVATVPPSAPATNFDGVPCTSVRLIDCSKEPAWPPNSATQLRDVPVPSLLLTYLPTYKHTCCLPPSTNTSPAHCGVSLQPGLWLSCPALPCRSAPCRCQCPDQYCCRQGQLPRPSLASGPILRPQSTARQFTTIKTRHHPSHHSNNGVASSPRLVLVALANACACACVPSHASLESHKYIQFRTQLALYPTPTQFTIVEPSKLFAPYTAYACPAKRPRATHPIRRDSAQDRHPRRIPSVDPA